MSTVSGVMDATNALHHAWDRLVDARDAAAPGSAMKAKLRKLASTTEAAISEIDEGLDAMGVLTVPDYDAMGANESGWKPTHRHLKSGGTYRILLIGKIEADLTPAVIYQGMDGVVWVRPEAEFFDGRFEPIIEQED